MSHFGLVSGHWLQNWWIAPASKFSFWVYHIILIRRHSYFPIFWGPIVSKNKKLMLLWSISFEANDLKPSQNGSFWSILLPTSLPKHTFLNWGALLLHPNWLETKSAGFFLCAVPLGSTGQKCRKIEFLNFWNEFLVFLNEISWFLSSFWNKSRFLRHFYPKIKEFLVKNRVF